MRTGALVRAVLGGAERSGASTRYLALAEHPEQPLLELDRADAFVFATPIYRASMTGLLKSFLDSVPRSEESEGAAPLRGRAVVIAATGGSDHHFLALNDLRNVLSAFFASFVLPPGIYVPRDGFGDSGDLSSRYAAQADLQGRALVEQARAIATSSCLVRVEPQA
jgi:FMN reductase